MQSDHRQPSNTQPPNMSKGVWFIVWIVILLLFVKFFEGQLGNRDKIVQQNKGPGEVVLKRSRNGHYFANGFINQSPVTFLLDTGATSVAIPKKVADRLGLQRGYQHYANTANGQSVAYQTKLNSLSFGNIYLYDVDASIVEGFEGNEILLGMSALKHLEFTQKGNELTLKQL